MIEVGEYVRTKNNGIKRVDTIFENKTVNKYGYVVGSDWDGKWYSYIKTTEILKHSKNILDLIEVGDIVEVLDIDWVRVMNIDDEDFLELFKEDIKKGDWKLQAILTKEQYNQNCYKVEED